MIDDSSMELWHKWIGHMSEKGLQIHAKKQLLPNIKGTPLKICTDYLTGKQHGVAFQRNSPSRKAHELVIFIQMYVI